MQINTEQRFCRKYHGDDRRQTVDYRVGHPYAPPATKHRHPDTHRWRHHPMDRVPVHTDPDGGPHPGSGRSWHNLHMRIVVQVKSISDARGCNSSKCYLGLIYMQFPI